MTGVDLLHVLRVEGVGYALKSDERTQWLTPEPPGPCFMELFGARLAHRLGIPVPRWTVVRWSERTWFGSQILWSGRPACPEDFADRANVVDLPLLVAFDCWAAMRDRHAGNVLVVEDSGRKTAYAIDHSALYAVLGRCEHVDALEKPPGFFNDEVLRTIAGNGAAAAAEVPPALLAAAARARAVSDDKLWGMLTKDVPPVWTPNPEALDRAHRALVRRRNRLPELLGEGWRRWHERRQRAGHNIASAWSAPGFWQCPGCQMVSLVHTLRRSPETPRVCSSEMTHQREAEPIASAREGVASRQVF